MKRRQFLKAAGLGVGGKGGNVGVALGVAPTASGGGLSGVAPRARPPTRARTRMTGRTSPAAAKIRLRGAIAFHEALIADMAGPYQTSPDRTLVRKYRTTVDVGAGVHLVTPRGRCAGGPLP